MMRRRVAVCECIVIILIRHDLVRTVE
jgi:hypothetical protein